jgi:hypothetical protein
MFDTTHMLKRLAQGVATVVALAALVVPSSLASTGSRYGGHDPWFNYAVSLTAKSAVPSYRFVTDTLGGNGHAKGAVPSYQFMTDTLAPGGGSSLAAAPSSPGFNWADAGVGAGVVAGALALLAGGLLAVRRRDAIPV